MNAPTNETSLGPDPEWLRLSEAIHRKEPGLLERMRVPPWDASADQIRRAWKSLTHPRNERKLRERLMQDLNRWARECTEAALEECVERARREREGA